MKMYIRHDSRHIRVPEVGRLADWLSEWVTAAIKSNAAIEETTTNATEEKVLWNLLKVEKWQSNTYAKSEADREGEGRSCGELSQMEAPTDCLAALDYAWA